LEIPAWYLLTEFPAASPGSKEGHFLAGAGTSEYVGDLEREELTQIYRYCRRSMMASIWLGSWP